MSSRFLFAPAFEFLTRCLLADQQSNIWLSSIKLWCQRLCLVARRGTQLGITAAEEHWKHWCTAAKCLSRFFSLLSLYFFLFLFFLSKYLFLTWVWCRPNVFLVLFTICGINRTAKNVFAEIEDMKELVYLYSVAFNHQVPTSRVGMFMFTVEINKKVVWAVLF